MSIPDSETLGKKYCSLREVEDIMHNVKLSDTISEKTSHTTTLSYKRL